MSVIVGGVKAVWLMNELSIQKSLFVGVNEVGIGEICAASLPLRFDKSQCSYLRHELHGQKWLSK